MQEILKTHLGYTVVLNDMEQVFARMMAQKRHNNGRAKGIVNQRIGPQSDFDTDLGGFGAEMAYAKLMNLYPDFGNILNDFDHAHHDGTQVDVKHTERLEGRLLAVRGKTEHPADVYVLAVGRFPKFHFIGYATAAELLNDHNLKDLGRGLGYVMEQTALHPLDYFIDLEHRIIPCIDSLRLPSS